MVMVMIMINSIIIILTNIIINIIVIVMMIKNLSASPSLAARSCSSHFAAAASTFRKKTIQLLQLLFKIKMHCV